MLLNYQCHTMAQRLLFETPCNAFQNMVFRLMLTIYAEDINQSCEWGCRGFILKITPDASLPFTHFSMQNILNCTVRLACYHCALNNPMYQWLNIEDSTNFPRLLSQLCTFSNVGLDAWTWSTIDWIADDAINRSHKHMGKGIHVLHVSFLFLQKDYCTGNHSRSIIRSNWLKYEVAPFYARSNSTNPYGLFAEIFHTFSPRVTLEGSETTDKIYCNEYIQQ